MDETDPHLVVCLASLTVAIEIIEVLPDCDLLGELETLLETNIEVLSHYIKNKHFGSDRLEFILSRLANMQYEVRKIKNADHEIN